MNQIPDIERPREVDIGSIERELRNIWRDANADPEHPAARSSLLNLVAVVAAAERELVSELAAEVALRHPCRMIVVLIDPDSKLDEVTAEVSARRHFPFGIREPAVSEPTILIAPRQSTGHPP